MSVDVSKAQVLQTQLDTPGGDTYWVVTPKNPDARALCFRQIVGSAERRCTKPAGHDTWHNGTGACANHGGATPEGMRLITGKYSKLRGTLAKRVEDYLQKDRDELLDMTEELAITRAVFDEFLEGYHGPQDDEYGLWLRRFQEITGTLGNLVEKMSRIDTRNTLTVAQVMYTKATIVDILLKYIADPDMRERAVREMASRLGGDQAIQLNRSELPRGGV